MRFLGISGIYARRWIDINTESSRDPKKRKWIVRFLKWRSPAVCAAQPSLQPLVSNITSNPFSPEGLELFNVVTAASAAKPAGLKWLLSPSVYID